MSPLPIDTHLDRIAGLLRDNSSLVLTATPGSGKTTRVPPYLLSLYSGKILVLEPRRMAAVAAADRVARERNWTLGKEVGYQVRFDTKTSDSTRLIYMTEALLARQLIRDPELNGVDLVVLDEFHERSIHIDLALSLVSELRELGRKIHLLLMSATLEAEPIAKFLGGAPILNVPTPQFELKIFHQLRPQKLMTDPTFFANLSETIKTAASKSQRDILIFLPGTQELERARDLMSEWAGQHAFRIEILHGSLALADQQRVLESSSQRRLIFTTNVAESSITIESCDTVIDSGLAKLMRHDPKSGFSRLDLTRISLANARQRAGRAARTGPGTCYRMWTEHEERSMRAQEDPEVKRIDLTEALLLLAQQGVTDFSKFHWFENPPLPALNQAHKTLLDLGAIDPLGQLTAIGREMSSYPLHPELSRLVLTARDLNLSALGCELAAILHERDFVRSHEVELAIAENWECDLTWRWNLLRQSSRIPANLRRVVDQLKRMVACHNDSRAADVAEIPRLLFLSFSHRLCRRRGDSDRALMLGGRGVKMGKNSLVRKSEFILALNGVDLPGQAESLISLGCGLDKSEILSLAGESIILQTRLEFDEERQKLYSVRQRFFGDLAIDDPSLSEPSPQQIAEHLPQLLLSRISWLRGQNPQFAHWLDRWDFACQNQLIDFDLNTILQTAFAEACYQEPSMEKVSQKDLVSFLINHLPREINGLLEKEVPATIVVPSGSRIRVEYPIGRAPYLEVRLQELFGWPVGPKLLQGQIPIVLHLLAPNFRPVQVTADLASFWVHGYPEVRGELRARYPKHSWPEDPKSARAEAKGRRRQN